ncbi:MAG TPA: hypothetical protein VLS45_06505 [Methylomicrobium sp.]|nr:hypothetical protein [Methylomicrobium sp.]
MVFPFAAVGLGLQAAGIAGQLAGLFGGGGGTQGRGRMNRALQAQMAAVAQAQQYAAAAADPTNPLFRKTAAAEEAKLRRSIASGLEDFFGRERLARARGLTAGVRSEREDESRARAIGELHQAASEKAGEIASGRLQGAANQLLGVAGGYGNAAEGFAGQYGMSFARQQASQQRTQGMFGLLGGFGSQLPSIGSQLSSIFSRGATSSAITQQAMNMPSFTGGGINIYKRQPTFYGP